MGVQGRDAIRAGKTAVRDAHAAAAVEATSLKVWANAYPCPVHAVLGAVGISDSRYHGADPNVAGNSNGTPSS